MAPNVRSVSLFFFIFLLFFSFHFLELTHLRFFTTPVSPQAAEACELVFFLFYQIYQNLYLKKKFTVIFFSSLMRLLDMRYAGVARGVGTAKMLGRVHGAQLKLADLYLPCPFTVMQVLHAVNILSFFKNLPKTSFSKTFFFFLVSPLLGKGGRYSTRS